MKLSVSLAAAALLSLSATVANATNHMVEQKGGAFAPGTLSVKLNDTVVFVNNDKVTHNVYSRSAGNEFRVSAQKPGEKTAIKFDSKGEIDVRCAMHPKMRLTINVE